MTFRPVSAVVLALGVLACNGASVGGRSAGLGGATGTGGLAGGLVTGGMVGASGTVGTGGTIGTGGVPGTGGLPLSGGNSGTSDTAGSGGAPGTGGTASLTCSPACSSSGTCCDGSNESCNGTPLPSGDGLNTGQFAISADGLTVTDTITGLVWQRDGSGTRAGCGGSNQTCTWAEAKAYCASLTLGGLPGWRLPAVMELRTILDLTVMDFAAVTSKMIDVAAFPNTPAAYFWTSSPFAGSSGNAWVVDFYEGVSGNKVVGSNYNVRCVR